VDLRGSGDSYGVLTDEYLEQELNDAVEIIQWLSEQPWCSGSVGMMGKSWGGFNALQVAAKQPKALKAIISVSSADDRYSTDVHYMGGCLLGDNLSWAAEMFSFNSCPPDPRAQGPEWENNWKKRLSDSGVWLKTWLEHSFRDEYWKHGSVCENYQDIKCPVFAISGWADGYSNTVFRLMENLEVPRLGLVGPWGHNYPHLGMPGPGMGFLQESVQWWDHWLNEKETDIMNSPKLRVWMQEEVPPSFTLEKRPGHWVGLSDWPTNSTEDRAFYFGEKKLNTEKKTKGSIGFTSPLSVGLFAGKWCSFSSTPDLPHDQREEDGGALVYETRPLNEEVEILGSPKVKLKLKVDQPVAMVAARIGDVNPSGAVTRVTYGLLNLTQHKGADKPEYLKPGEEYDVEVSLNHVAQRFSKGHRIRLSLSTSYWPICWPSPKPVKLTIKKEESSLILPEVNKALETYENKWEPEGAPPLTIERTEKQDYKWRVIRDLGEDFSELQVLKNEGRYYIPSVDMEVERCSEENYKYSANDYSSLSGEVKTSRAFRHHEDDWETEIKTKTKLSSDAEYFYIQADLDAWYKRRRVFSESWHEKIPRKYI